MVRIENNSYTFEIKCEVSFSRLLKNFDTCSPNVVETWFLLHETWHTTQVFIYFCVEMIRIENNRDMLDITIKVTF